MIWIPIVYLAGFAGTFLAVSWAAQQRLDTRQRVIASLLWFLTLPFAAYIIWRMARA